jgi:glycosyltransferase involved in cell wall biosynthesis
MLERLLYTSLVDVSLPYGPGVNERVFLHDMLGRFGENLVAVIPSPVRGLPSELKGLRLWSIPTGRSVRTPSGWLVARTLGSPRLVRAIRRFRPSLIVMRVGSFPLPQFLACRSLSVPYVLKTASDVSFRRFNERNGLARSLKGVNQAMFTRIVRGAACVDVVSSAQRDLAIGLNPELRNRIHVIDNGVDLARFRPSSGIVEREALGFDADDLVIGYVGNFPMQRGGREVIDAVAALRSSARVKGLIVGDTGEGEACRAYARELGVSESVRIHGEAEYDDVPRLMAAMDVGLSILRPRERGESEQKVRQYLAMGLCVVGTSGSNDLLRGHPFARVVDTHDSDEVVGAVRAFVELGRDGIARLGTGARSFAESALSSAARNDERLALWNESLGHIPPAPSTEQRRTARAR